MDVFTPQYRMDRNANGCGTALYVRESKVSRQISIKNDRKDIEYLFAEINISKI